MASRLFLLVTLVWMVARSTTLTMDITVIMTLLGEVAGIIKGADIAVGNLQSPFVTKTMLRDRLNDRTRVFLDADPPSASALK